MSYKRKAVRDIPEGVCERNLNSLEIFARPSFSNSPDEILIAL